jgi:hypothetical protein
MGHLRARLLSIEELPMETSGLHYQGFAVGEIVDPAKPPEPA